MANLFWKTKQETKSLVSTPFKTEEEFEKFIFNTPEIFKDIFLLHRQIKGGKKIGIPDVIGIDIDGNVCIIEMKNCSVDDSIVPQVLKYAIWAESSPDSIKKLWLEADNRPDRFELNDDFEVRIIIIAPDIFRTTLKTVNKINYQVDLIEIKRWVEADNQLLLVNKLEEEKGNKVRLTRGLQVYDEKFYLNEYNKKSAREFLKYTKEIESIIKKKGWALEMKYNKHYCGFKAGFFNAFGINWVGSKTFGFFFKLSEKQLKTFQIKMTRYESEWKQGVYYIQPGITKTQDFIPLFEMAYKELTGK